MRQVRQAGRLRIFFFAKSGPNHNFSIFFAYPSIIGRPGDDDEYQCLKFRPNSVSK